MPIPKIMGTENEYVINATGLIGLPGTKMEEEHMIALELLTALSNEFFPGITDKKTFLGYPEDKLEDDEFMNMVLRRRSERNTLDIDYGTGPDYVPGFMTHLGSRFYIDHGYLEGSSAENDNPFSLLACEIAQDELIAEKLETHFADDPRRPRFYKNVSDGQGNSQAAHRNFCVSEYAWESLVSPYREAGFYVDRLTRETKLLITWHVVEQILTGAGKYGSEDIRYSPGELAAMRNIFQLSGRADFAGRLVGIETTHSRPIVNQRYEPLADPRKYGRYHCICGDATRAEWSFLFKMGLTAIVIGMIEDEALNMDFHVSDPLSAITEVSYDPTCKRPIKVESFRNPNTYELSPLDIMRVFLKEMGRYLGSRPGAPQWAFRILEKAFWASSALERNPALLGQVLDWKIKEMLGQGRPNAFNIHINYHALSGKNCIYRNLVKAGVVETVVSREEIEKRKVSPPENTRAYFRGKFIGQFYRDVDFNMTDWTEIVLKTHGEKGRLQIIQTPEPLELTKEGWGTIFEGKEPVTLEYFKNMIVGSSSL